jgi:LacI family transcriptional regulator
MAELAEYGITVFTHHLNSEDVKEQIRLLGELRKQGVCGIAIEPINHPEVISKFNTLHKEGIEIVTFGNDIQGSKRLAYVGCDYYACGQTVGNMIGLLLDGHGKLAIVSGDSTYRDHPHRIAGCIDKVNKHYPGIAVVENIHCPTDDISTYTVVRELMGKHNALNALFFNAIASFGALRAIEEIGKRIKIVSTDRISDMKSYLSSGLVSAVITHQPWLQGTMPLDILFNFHVLGIKPSFDSYYTSNEIKIAENVNEQFFDDAWGKVSKQWSDISARMGPLNCTENTFVSPSQPRPEG